MGQVGTIDAPPAGGKIVRAWDLAATAQSGTRDPDWTVGVKLMRTAEGRFVVLDVTRLRGGPDDVEQAIVNKSLGVAVSAEKRGMVGYGCFEDAMAALETAVAGKTYVAGDRFSAADVYVGSQIGWGLMFGSIEKRPAFEAYWNGIKDRPAAVRAREIDDALLPPKP